MTDFFKGAQFLLSGFRLIRQSGLRRYVVIPLLINIAVFAVLTWVGIYQFEALMQWLLPKGDSWWIETLKVVLWIVFGFVALLVFYFLFSLAANIVASPFNSLLAEKVLLKLGQNLPETHGWSSAFTGFPKAMASEGRKLIYFMFIFLALTVLTVIPVLQIAAPVLWPVATGWMLSLEYAAYPVEASGQLFQDTRRKARENRMMALGFGMTAMLFTLIPLVNLLVIPAAVAGASAMWADRWSRKSP